MLLFGVGMPAEHRTGAFYEIKTIKPIDERKVVGFFLRSEGLMMYSNLRKVHKNAEEMKDILKRVKKAYTIVYGKKPADIPFSKEIAWIEDKMVEFRVTCNIDGKPCTYIFKKDCTEDKQKVEGKTTYATLNHYYKVPSFKDDEYVKEALQYDESNRKFEVSYSGLLYHNPKFERIRIEGCYGYDLNSSYPNAMLNRMPDTSKPYRVDSKVEEGEIGFIAQPTIKEDGSLSTILQPVFKGIAEFVFPLMDSPFKKFVEVWYGRKKNAKTSFDREKAKQMMNYAIGYLQKHNPFLRATVLYYANLAISSKMDEDTLHCSTDSLVSKRKRDDLEIGAEIGQFKLEHEGSFYYDGMNYQWNLEIPTYRHIPKTWFKKDWDLAKDPIPKSGNLYRFDKAKLNLIKEKKHDQKFQSRS